MMQSFSDFILEAWANGITQGSKEKSVTSDTKYDDPQDFKKGSKKLGKVGDLELHVHDTGSSMTHFTWSPKDRKIHHVLHAAQKTETKDGTELKFLSAHGRQDSSVRMSQVYKSLIKDHGRTMVGTGHSPGAVKMWAKLHADPEIQIHGRHGNKLKPIKPGDAMYADRGDKSDEAKKIGKMELVAKAA